LKQKYIATNLIKRGATTGMDESSCPSLPLPCPLVHLVVSLIHWLAFITVYEWVYSGWFSLSVYSHTIPFIVT
jgi:hypothetical protein